MGRSGAGEPSSPGGVRTQRGPPAVGARQRCSAGGFVRQAEESRRSDGQPAAPLEPPGPQDRPASPGCHPRPEPVGLGPLAGVRLVRPFHVRLAFRGPPTARRRRSGCRPPECTLAGAEGIAPPMLGAIHRSPLVAAVTTVYVRTTRWRPVFHTCGPRCGRSRPEGSGGAGGTKQWVVDALHRVAA
jgi:hypothetical protein